MSHHTQVSEAGVLSTWTYSASGQVIKSGGRGEGCRAHLQVQVQTQVSELILQKDTEVHVLH
jgi:hypothetical protein